jgi:endonuclease/exonuclease/phosphatase family metal-dependent hydrolase
LGRPAAVALLLAALVPAGCARAVSYLDPATPFHPFRQAQAPPAPDSRAFRVVSFNIAHAIEIARALEVLRETPGLAQPDAIALQEMDGPGTDRIARALGLNAVYFPSGIHPAHQKDFGCAVLSPWPLEEPRKLVLPHGARVTGLRRAAVSATVVRGEVRVRVYSLHLPAPLSISGRSRRAQLLALARDAEQWDMPVVVAGDFNSHRKAGELTRAGFEWVTRETGDTTRFRLFGLTLGGLSYDHVLVRGLRPASGPGATGVADHRGASDHRPIWAHLELTAPD